MPAPAVRPTSGTARPPAPTNAMLLRTVPAGSRLPAGSAGENLVAMEMVPIPAGTFLMGSADSEPGHSPAEGPQTWVTLTRPFWLGKTEVTQDQWRALMGNNPSQHRDSGSLPVEMVSWNMAMDFCRRLTAQERAGGRLPAGFTYTLPTDAQWEYACRAGTIGPDVGNLDAMAWSKSNSDGATHPVGTKQPNPWGLSDMQGNVWEWCLDGGQSPGAALPGGNVTDPAVSTGGDARLRRGGGYDSGPGYLRPAVRNLDRPPTFALPNIGFRVALSQSFASAPAARPAPAAPRGVARPVSAATLQIVSSLAASMSSLDPDFLRLHTNFRDDLAKLAMAGRALERDSGQTPDETFRLQQEFAAALDETISITDRIAGRPSETADAVAKARDINARLRALVGR